MSDFTLYNDDCLNALKSMDENSIDSCVTDPPYGLSFMGKHWDYDVPSADIWREVLRVLKPGGHLLAFFGSRTYHRGVIQIEDSGFEIRDQIMWLYGSGFPKSHNIGDGWGTALKPAHEPIVVARKPIEEKTIAENVLKHGTGAINIDESRVDYVSDYDKKHQEDIARGQDNAKNGKFFGGKGKTKASSHTPTGRWPANVIHDGSDEVVKEFPETKSGIAIQRNGGGQKIGGNGIYGGSKGLTREDVGYDDSGSVARFFYCAKASKSDRDEGLEQFLAKKIVTFQTGGGASGNASSLSANRNTEYKNIHPTVKPTDLMKYLVKLTTPKNGVILDPFMGSGTTGKACGFEGFKFVGIERDPEYFEIAKARIEHAYDNKTVNLEQFFI